MGKSKKTNQRSIAPRENSSTSVQNENNDRERQIDLLTSQLLDLCSQKSTAQETTDILWKEHLEIRQKVNELRKLQLSSSEDADGGGTARSDRLQILEKWCVSNGLRTNGVSIAAVGGQDTNFGLRTEKPLDAGELVVQVPRQLFLSVENVLKRNANLRLIFDSDPLLKGMPNVALSVVLSIEKLKGADSFWFAYVDSLPAIRMTPLYFLCDGKEDLLEILRGSAAFEEVLKLYKNVVRQYAYFRQLLSSTSGFGAACRQLLPKKSFTFDLYLWAVITVMTRINLVPSSRNDGNLNAGETTGMIPALIPFFDMANHGNVAPCTDFMDRADRQCAVIYSPKAYQPRDELIIYYGERKYWEFFVFNGFVYDDGRRYPNVYVKLGLSSSDRLLSLKTEALLLYGMQPSEHFLVSKYGTSSETGSPVLPKSMERFAVVFCADEEELRSFCTATSEARESHWSIKTVDGARRFLITRLSLLLRTYSTLTDGDSAANYDATTAASGESIFDQQQRDLLSKFVHGERDSLKSAMDFLQQQSRP